MGWDRQTAGILLALILALGLIAGCGDDDGEPVAEPPPPEQQAEQPAPDPGPEVNERAIARSLAQFFDAYNAGNYGVAIAFIHRSQRCGGAPDWASAYSQNHDFEGIDYELVKLEVTAVRDGGDAVDADVTIRETDADTGMDPQEQLLGLTFVKHAGEWVSDQNLLGAEAFCP